MQGTPPPVYRKYLFHLVKQRTYHIRKYKAHPLWLVHCQAPVAQLVERWTSKQKMPGSNPSQGKMLS